MKFRLVFILCFISYNLSYSQNGGVWTWIHGDTILGTKNYGIKGIASPTNLPPGRYHPAFWQDLNGKFWIFSGSPAPSDMWMYDPVTNLWTWMSGDSTQTNGVYGTKGVPSVSNYPKWRGWGASCWTDSLGDLWMFAGSGCNDLWRYHIPTNEWTWISGDNPNTGLTTVRSHGTKNVPAASNFPGVRAECKSNWVYKNELIFFAGAGGFNDVWSYSIKTDEWTWIGGQNSTSTVNYGTMGVSSTATNPPAGSSYTRWKSGSKLYVFSIGGKNDIWSFDMVNKEWTWELGQSPPSAAGITPSANCISGGFFPKARGENHTIQTSECNRSFWTYGGGDCDLWLYRYSLNDWIRVSKNSNKNCRPIYGIKGIASLSNHPGSKAGFPMWADANNNLYIFSGSSSSNDLWKFEPDSACLSGFSLDVRSIVKPLKTTICTSNDSVVLTLDTALYNITWNPTTQVTINTDTSRLVFKPAVKTDYMVTAFGGKCISIDTLRFTVNMGSHTFDTIRDTTCLAGKYPFTQSGIYDYKIKTRLGCDSNIRLHLTMRNNIDTTFAEICKGSTYLFQGTVYSTSGTYNKTYQNQYSCDSTKVLVLKVNNPDTLLVKQTICQGDTFTYRGQKFAKSGDYNFARGCGYDILSLWVRPKDSFVIFDTFCTGDTFKYQSHRYTNSGSYSHKYVNADGCDSFMVFNLHVKSKTSDTIRIDSIILDNLCSVNNKRIYIFPLNIDGKNKYTRDFGLSYQPASIFYNLTAGTYPIRIKRGCTFLDTPIMLPYRERDTSVINDETCVLFPYYFNGKYHTKSGIYWDTFTNVYNCDSFIKLNLTVYKTDSSTIRDTICKGDTVMFDGFPKTVAGTYYKYIKLFEGCDSTVKLILTVKRRDTMVHNRSICRGDTLRFAGNQYTESGAYKLSYLNKEGCDSFVHLNLTVKRRDTFILKDTICKGAVKMFENKSHTVSGQYIYKLMNNEGCDSFRILNLVVNRQDTNTLKYSKCLTDSVIHGGITYKTTGVHNKLYKNIFNCDSLVILDLKFSNFETQTVNKSICPGDIFEGYKNAGTHYDTFKRAGKCDSIRELILVHTPIPITRLAASICQSQTYTYRSKTYKAKGIYFDTIVTSKNCDSIIELDLKVKDSSSFSFSHFICKNETFLFNNQSLNLPGIYKDTFQNAVGCDSFVYLSLGYKQPIYDSIKVEKCFGQNYRGYTKTGEYKDTILTVNGCDSILKIDLKILAGPYSLNQKFEDCNSINFKNKMYTNSILIHDTLYNKLSCDSIYRKTDIVIRPKPIKMPLQNFTFCDSIRMSDGKVYKYNFMYTDTIRTQDILHCDSLFYPKELEKKTRVKLFITLAPSVNEFYRGEKIELSIYPARKLYWNTGDTVAKFNLIVNQDQTIEVIGWDSEECKDTATIDIKVLEPGILDIPKAFAPGGMIENRIFKPNFHGMVDIISFSVYNRWGEKIYQTNSKDNIGWDGTYKGEEVPSGVFSYILEYKVNRNNFFKSGEVLLVR